MEYKFEIITNNPLVKEVLGKEYGVVYKECSYEELLITVRNKVHEGYELLTHPLSGSIKPKETPYKSVMVGTIKGKLDMQAVEIINNAVLSCKKFELKSDKYTEKVYEDFQLIDLTLIQSALPAASAW